MFHCNHDSDLDSLSPWLESLPALGVCAAAFAELMLRMSSRPVHSVLLCHRHRQGRHRNQLRLPA